MAKSYTVVDLFAGIGGLSLGFLNSAARDPALHFDVRLLVDFDPTAAFTFKKNHPTIPFWPTDLRTASPEDILRYSRCKTGLIDFLIGGPPCQGFSANGKRWLEDQRNQLMARFVSIANCLKPRCAIIENVPSVLSSYEALFHEQLHEAFPGYLVKTAILNASSFGVPQMRKRAFVVAIREDLRPTDFSFPQGPYDSIEIGNHSRRNRGAKRRFVSVGDALSDLPSLRAGQSADGVPYPSRPLSDYQTERRQGSLAVFNHVARAHSRDFLRKISPIRPGKGNSDLPPEQKFSDNYFSQAYARLHARGIAHTVTANFRNPGSGRFTHYKDRRSITVREAARLQGFDDRFVFHGFETDQERHVGNAVPPLLAEALAVHFGRALNSC